MTLELDPEKNGEDSPGHLGYEHCSGCLDEQAYDLSVYTGDGITTPCCCEWWQPAPTNSIE